MNAMVEEFKPGPLTVAQPAEVTPMQMLQIAVAQGADLDRLQQLMDLQERWEANQARKAYVAAMAAFKAEPFRILKTKKVDIPGGAKFAHATLADVCDGIIANLSKHGLSHKWDLNQDGEHIQVTCVITHALGHSERVKIEALPDDSGKKNKIQQVASTITYLERYTLMAACGLSAKDMDDDGRGAAPQKPQEEAPAGYNNWRADMTALADEGLVALTASWGKSEASFRRFVVKFDEPWWSETKAKAGKVAK